MKKRMILPLMMVLAALALLLWAPWLTPSAAEQRAGQVFSSAWQGVADGCGLNCTGCGVKAARKTWFGYNVEVEYACGMLPEDSPEYHERRQGFVSALGTVHGLPVP